MTSMPAWEEFMRPVLEVLSDQVVRDRRELGLEVSKYLNLTQDQIQETTASGQPLFMNRMGWGLSFMSNVGALARPSRGLYTITDAGKWLLAKFPNGFTERDVKGLGADPEAPISVYVATTTRKTDPGAKEIEQSALTPTEQVQNGIARINEEIGAELLLRLQGKEPAFFEQAVVDLLLAMGYGGAKGRGGVTPISNDAGIDGVIDQDVLGLNRVYIQAKRYAEGNTVGRPDVQAFEGALSGLADSGVFITTSKFSDGAVQYAKGVPTRITLIDGKQLSELMIRFSVGIQVSATYKIVEIDEDFFA